MRLPLHTLPIATLLLSLSLSSSLRCAEAELAAQPSAWQHFTMDDLQIDVARFQPIRSRYVQEMLDLNGSGAVSGRLFVHIELDRALHSGLWNSTNPASITPWREPGVVVDWKIQNGVYNAYDRVLTDSRMATVLRAMPADPYGLLLGATREGQHTRLRAPLGGSDSSFAVIRRPLPHGAVNVLTVPYLLAAMDLEPGDRFTLPGFALIGGPDGLGRRWRAAFAVQARTRHTLRGQTHQIVTVTQWRVDPTRIDSLSGDVPPPQPEQRYTRHLISDRPPYFIGRGDYITRDDGSVVRVREQLDLIDWAPIPLPVAELIERDVWAMDSTAQGFILKPQHTPDPLVPRTP